MHDAYIPDAFDIHSVVGWTLAEAKAEYKKYGLFPRVVCENGVGRAITMELRRDRVNVEVESGKVSKVIDIG